VTDTPSVPGDGIPAGLVHADRAVTVGFRDGGRVVRKRYRDTDASVVFGDMVRLWASPFGASGPVPSMPEPLGLEGGDTIVMTAIDGQVVGTQWSLDDSNRRGPDCAELLARLHTSGVVVDRRRRSSGVLRSLGRKAARLEGSDWPLAGPWRDAVRDLGPIGPSDELLVVSHGDFSPRNILIGADGGFTLIDFDRLQMASPSRDVEHWGSWCWAAQVLQGAEPDWADTDPFRDAYRRAARAHGAERPDDAGRADEAAFHRATSLLRIAEAWTAFRARPAEAERVIAEARSVARRR